jgi:hypothetical protein
MRIGGKPRGLPVGVRSRNAFEHGCGGIHHVFVAGVIVGPLIVWQRDRRVHNGRVLCDHTSLERVVG